MAHTEPTRTSGTVHPSPTPLSPSEPALVPPAVEPRSAELSSDLVAVATSLHDQYDHELGAAVVTGEIHLVADRFEAATIRSFVPLFVRRYAGEGLRARHEMDGSPRPRRLAPLPR
jgi:hypothetical protein